MKKIIVVLLAVCVLFTVGCSQMVAQQTQKVISMGEMDGNTYTNEYFGVRFEVPEDWTSLNKQELDELMQRGAEAVADDNESQTEDRKVSEVHSIELVYSFKYDLSYAEGYNPSFKCKCVGGNLDLAGITIKTGADYLEQAKKELSHSKLPITIGNKTQETIGSKEFDVLEITTDLEFITTNETYYATVINGYVLIFAILFEDETQKAELQSILDTVTFE